MSQKQLQLKWEPAGNQLANKGYHCRHRSDAQFAKDPNENAKLTQTFSPSENTFLLNGSFLCLGEKQNTAKPEVGGSGIVIMFYLT